MNQNIISQKNTKSHVKRLELTKSGWYLKFDFYGNKYPEKRYIELKGANSLEEAKQLGEKEIEFLANLQINENSKMRPKREDLQNISHGLEIIFFSNQSEKLEEIFNNKVVDIINKKSLN